MMLNYHQKQIYRGIDNITYLHYQSTNTYVLCIFATIYVLCTKYELQLKYVSGVTA